MANVISPIQMSQSMANPMTAQMVGAGAEVVLASILNRSLGFSHAVSFRDAAFVDNVVTVVTSNLITLRPQPSLLAIVNQLRKSQVTTANTEIKGKQLAILGIVERASLSYVLWMYRKQATFTESEIEYLDHALNYEGRFRQTQPNYFVWLQNVEPTSLAGISSELFKLIIADKAKLILEAGPNLRSVAYLCDLLSRIPNEYKTLASRSNINVEAWKSIAPSNSALANFLGSTSSSEMAPFETGSI